MVCQKILQLIFFAYKFYAKMYYDATPNYNVKDLITSIYGEDMPINVKIINILDKATQKSHQSKINTHFIAKIPAN